MMTDGGLGDAHEGLEGGTEAFGDPGSVLGLPGVGDEVMVESFDEGLLVLGVVLDDGEVGEADGEEHGGGAELVGLLFEEFLEGVAGEGHVLEVGVELVEEDDVDGGVGVRGGRGRRWSRW